MSVSGPNPRPLPPSGPSLVFAISIPIASVAPVTVLSWITIVPLLRLIDWRVRKA